MKAELLQRCSEHLVFWVPICMCVSCVDPLTQDKVSPTDDSGAVDSGGCDSPAAWYEDADGDGFGSGSSTISACEAPEGWVADSTDCADSDLNVYPGAVEICNDGRPNDCDDPDGAAATAACPADGPYAISGADALLMGEEQDAAAGAVVAGPGDVNGDGRADLLIGAPYWGAGAAYLVPGGVTGRHSLSEADARFMPSTDEVVRAGSALSGIGDMDGDDLPEIAIGVPQGFRSEAGVTFVVSGLVTGAFDLADSDAAVRGEWPGDRSGTSVAGLGDVDGDGWDDLLIGAPSVNGSSVESDAGDCEWVDDEGTSAGRYVGAGFVVSGPVSGTTTLEDATAKLFGEDSADGAGWTAARAGDLDGDGLGDVLIGAMGHCAAGFDSGAVYAVLGPVSGTGYLADADGKMVGEGTSNRAGEALSSAGDVDGDGTPDVLVGAPELDGPDVRLQGRVYLVAGPALGIQSLTDAAATFDGESTGYEAGQSVSSARDMDGDGFSDLIIGSMLSGPDSTYPGAAYVIYGPASGTTDLGEVTAIFTGVDNEHVGYSVAGVGDTNLDGMPDLLIGIFEDNTAYHWAGAAALILGGGPAFDGTWGP